VLQEIDEDLVTKEVIEGPEDSISLTGRLDDLMHFLILREMEG